MSDKFGIDDKTRFLVLYFDAQMNLSDISKNIDRAESTIRNWESKLVCGIDFRKVKKGRGRKNEITDEIANTIFQQINENPERASLRKIAALVGKSKSSIQRFLAMKGMRYKGFDTNVVYAERERLERVDFCCKMIAEGGKLTL